MYVFKVNTSTPLPMKIVNLFIYTVTLYIILTVLGPPLTISCATQCNVGAQNTPT